MTRDFYRCASKELRLLPILGKDPPRAEEELLGPGATRERFRGAGDAGESGGRGSPGSPADAGGRGRGRPVSVSGAEEICFSNREAEAESQWILAARRVYHLQHLAS